MSVMAWSGVRSTGWGSARANPALVRDVHLTYIYLYHTHALLLQMQGDILESFLDYVIV